MYDPVKMHLMTASENAGSNGIVARHGQILVHKVVIDGALSNALSLILLFDAATATGTALIGLRTPVVATGSVFGGYAEANFSPPVPFEVGLSASISNSGSYRIYYTAQ